MLIEQIIELELRGLEPLDRTCTPTTGYFHVKTKISEENLRVDYYLFTTKILTRFNPKMQNYKLAPVRQLYSLRKCTG